MGRLYMSRASKSTLSRDSKYFVEKNRYHELRYFCLQYPIWKKRRNALVGLATTRNREPTEVEAFERIALEKKIKMVEFSAESAAFDLSHWLLIGVTTGLPYDKINAADRIPCGRELYYAMYRKFFWILSSIRD